MKLESRCIECGEPASVDEEMSNDNWTVYKKDCGKCGGQTRLVVADK